MGITIKSLTQQELIDINGGNLSIGYGGAWSLSGFFSGVRDGWNSFWIKK